MSFNEFIASAFLLVLSGVGVILWALFNRVGIVQISVAGMNSELTQNRAQLDDHEDRIRDLEKNPALC